MARSSMAALVVCYAGLALAVVGVLQVRGNRNLGLTLIGVAVAMVVIGTFLGRPRGGGGPGNALE